MILNQTLRTDNLNSFQYMRGEPFCGKTEDERIQWFRQWSPIRKLFHGFKMLIHNVKLTMCHLLMVAKASILCWLHCMAQLLVYPYIEAWHHFQHFGAERMEQGEVGGCPKGCKQHGHVWAWLQLERPWLAWVRHFFLLCANENSLLALQGFYF